MSEEIIDESKCVGRDVGEMVGPGDIVGAVVSMERVGDWLGASDGISEGTVEFIDERKLVGPGDTVGAVGSNEILGAGDRLGAAHGACSG